jgi:hypothetical protein
MNENRTLNERELFELSARIAMIVADEHINAGQAIDALSQALAMVVTSVPEMHADNFQYFAESNALKVTELAREYRGQGLGKFKYEPAGPLNDNA